MNISVIIPVFNGEKFIAEALDSVLAQTLPAYEIIIIDDGSTDGSAQIIQNAYADKVKYIYQENSGVSVARNLGIQLAQGEFIAFIDQDDMYLPTKFKNELELFKQNQDALIISGKWRYFFASEHLKNNFIYQEQIDKEQYGNFLGAYLFKKSLFELIGDFDAELDGNEDVDLFLRIKDKGIATIMSDKLSLLYRHHENNTSKTDGFANNLQERMLKMLHKSLQSKRSNKT